MKKMFTVLFILIVSCTFIFATDHRLNVGAGFDYSTGKAAKKDSSHPDRFLKYYAPQLSLGYNIEFDNNIVLYDNVGLGYVMDLQIKGKESPWDTKDKWEKFNENEMKYLIQEDFGAAYAFHFDKIRLLAGLGVHYDMVLFDASKLDTNNIKLGYFADLGANALIQGEYDINDHFSAFISLRPSVYLLEFWKWTKTLDCDGFETGLTGSAVIGASYKF